MLAWQEGSDVALTLAERPLGRGGEALIFAVEGDPYSVAKIYLRPTPERASKLVAMLVAPPVDPMAKAGHTSITWPTARLVNGEGQFVGYLMPRIENARLIVEFYTPRTRLQHCPKFHYAYLLRTARNLATAVGALHERGYVIGDLNESNVLVTVQALVSLVDTDSFQVREGASVFRCRVGKPEYTPPELQGARFAEIDRDPEHDAFGLGVLIFQLLMQGMHPFAGVSPVGGDAIPSRIRAGHWPYASVEMPVRPSPHAPPWEVMPPTVQTLMRRCFEEGHVDPRHRPTADEWRRAIADDEKLIISCERNSQHRYHGSLAQCPWCALAETQGRDPFPTAAMLKEAEERAAPVTQPAIELPAEPEPPRRKERKPIPSPPVSLRPTSQDLQLALRDAALLLGIAALVALVLWMVSNWMRRASQHVERIDIERVLNAGRHALGRHHARRSWCSVCCSATGAGSDIGSNPEPKDRAPRPGLTGGPPAGSPPDAQWFAAACGRRWPAARRRSRPFRALRERSTGPCDGRAGSCGAAAVRQLFAHEGRVIVDAAVMMHRLFGLNVCTSILPPSELPDLARPRPAMS